MMGRPGLVSIGHEKAPVMVGAGASGDGGGFSNDLINPLSEKIGVGLGM